MADWVFHLMAVVALSAAITLLIWSLLLDRARGRRRCPKCWYDMSGSPSLRCPECGHTARSEKKLLRTRRRWRGAALSFLLLIGAGAAALTPKIRHDGWLSITPTTVLILAPRYVKDERPYLELYKRVVDLDARRFDADRLSRRQWEMLAESCLQSMEDVRAVPAKRWQDAATDGDVRRVKEADVARNILLYDLAQTGIDAPERLIDALVAEILIPPASIDVTFLFDLHHLLPFFLNAEHGTTIYDWLRDDVPRLRDAMIERLLRTDQPGEVWPLLTVIVHLAPDERWRVVRDLVLLIPQMQHAASMEEAADELLQFIQEPTDLPPTLDEYIPLIDGFIAWLATDSRTARAKAQFMLHYIATVHRDAVAETIQRAHANASSDVVKDKLDRTLELIALPPDDPAMQRHSRDPALQGPMLVRLWEIDPELAAYVMRDYCVNERIIFDVDFDDHAAWLDSVNDPSFTAAFLKEMVTAARDWGGRKATAAIIGRLQTPPPAAIELLNELADDPHEMVRDEARSARQRLGLAEPDD